MQFKETNLSLNMYLFLSAGELYTAQKQNCGWCYPGQNKVPAVQLLLAVNNNHHYFCIILNAVICDYQHKQQQIMGEHLESTNEWFPNAKSMHYSSRQRPCSLARKRGALLSLKKDWPSLIYFSSPTVLYTSNLHALQLHPQLGALLLGSRYPLTEGSQVQKLPFHVMVTSKLR